MVRVVFSGGLMVLGVQLQLYLVPQTSRDPGAALLQLLWGMPT